MQRFDNAREAALGLVSLRRNLFPQAPAFVPEVAQ